MGSTIADQAFLDGEGRLVKSLERLDPTLFGGQSRRDDPLILSQRKIESLVRALKNACSFLADTIDSWYEDVSSGEIPYNREHEGDLLRRFDDLSKAGECATAAAAELERQGHPIRNADDLQGVARRIGDALVRYSEQRRLPGFRRVDLTQGQADEVRRILMTGPESSAETRSVPMAPPSFEWKTAGR